MASEVEQLKAQFGRFARLCGDPEGRLVHAGRLKRLLRQLDTSSATFSDDGLNGFMSIIPKQSDEKICVTAFVDWLYDDTDLSLPKVSAIPVFWSNHQTPTCRAARLAWLARELATDLGAVDEETMNIKASMPPFNRNRSMDLPSSVQPVNVPVFGPSIPNAVMRIFEAHDMRALAERLMCRIPSYGLNLVIQSKMPKVLDLVKAARGLEDIVQRHGAAIDSVENFAKGIQDLKPSDMTDLSVWSTFVHRYAKSGWERKLHFDHLLENFGFDTEASDVLRKQKHILADGAAVSMDGHALRWLSKAFAAYGVEGCLTDVVNLIFAMMGIEPKGLDESTIASYVDQFRENHLATKDFSKLWVPLYFVMDAESDDSLAWIILECVHEARGTKLKTFVQLPADEYFDEAAAKLESLPGGGVYVYRDPEAKNGTAVKQNLGMCYSASKEAKEEGGAG